MHADINTCRHILENTFPQIPIQNLSVIQTGWDTLVLVVDDRYIFRFPRRPELEAQLEKEMDLLPMLAGLLPKPVPRVEFARFKSRGDAHTLMGYSRIPGIGLETLPSVSETLIRQVGEFLTALHRIPLEQASLLVSGSTDPQGWRKQYLETYTWVQDLAFPHLSGPDRLATSLLWEIFLSSNDNFHFQPVLIHGDLGPEHILCEPDGTQVNGVIDWGDARLGDPALDFAGLFSLGGEALVDSALSGYQGQVDKTFRRRVRFYHTIAPLYEIRYALDIADESHLRHAAQALSQTLRV
jgi:aminoglycoside 2''-phosphotransferase